MKNERRIRILPENEIEDLFSAPIFNDEERLMWFELSQEEYSLLLSKKSLVSKIDLILQLGYFKAKHQFFSFTLDDVKEDTNYILNRFFSEEILTKTDLSRAQRNRNQLSILNIMQMTLFSAKEHIPMLLEKAHSFCRISNDPLFLFRNLFDYLKTNKITIPGYTTFQEHIISVALHRENDRLYSGLSLNMSLLEREALLTVLDNDDHCYAITCLKKHPKNFKLTSIQEEADRYEKILPLASNSHFGKAQYFLSFL